METNRSVAFFDSQFERQAASADFALNPFEQVALPYVRGSVLDLGCGLGNLAVAAARRGAAVVAVDASAHGIGRITATARKESLDIRAVLADVTQYDIGAEYDAVVSIGLLMFFAREEAMALLERLQRAVRSGGVAVVNVLTEGTTYMDMFEPGRYCLFGRDELQQRFAGWDILRSTHETFAAPGGTSKAFATIIARKP